MNRSAKFWDKLARKYSQMPIKDEENYQKKLAETQAYFSPDSRVLEFGCGTGSTAIAHAPHVNHIDAIDISENMINIGREKAKEADIENVSFHQGTLEQFNADSSTMDAVLALNVVHLLPDRLAAMNESNRILKSGGVFITSAVCLGASHYRFIKWVAPIGKLLGLLPDIKVMTVQELNNELAQAGFTIESQWQHGPQDISVFTIARKMA
ncbi:class I SAM-dependent methyltransferase [Vibrio hannami]|uniref:class I SAM-dependent methyltransferase n=1 Tax=Vibrio hannami TaxID=2717094 RepID=UPI00240EEFEA|nr:class I SAM-dependent methyltransferase [Vibrio hannami]MDG3087818.1 class I SAM-dependent methyltransferase [Vibrio hannami]